MKTWKKIVRLVLLVVVLLPVAAMIGIQIPAVQTWTVGRVADRLTRNLDGTAHVGKVYFSYPNNLILKDVDIIQGADDTIAHVGKLLLKVKATSLLLSDEARIRRVSVEDGWFSIRRLDDSTTNLSRLIAPLLKTDQEPREPAQLKWESVHLDRLTLKNIDFSSDEIAFQDINLTARKLYYDGKSAGGRVENLSLKKGDELEVSRFGVDATYDSTGIMLHDLIYDDSHSMIVADRVSLGFRDFSDFSQFTDKVAIDASLHGSRLDLKTVEPFLDLGGRQLALIVDGQVSGTVSNLQSNRLRIASDSGKTRLEVKFKARGLPDLDHTQLHAEVVQGETTTADLGGILAGILPGFKPSTLSAYAPGETLSLTAQADGPMSDLQTSGRLQLSSMGSADFNANLHLKGSRFAAEGSASTSALQLGGILGQPSLGSLTCHTDLTFSTSPKGLSFDIFPLSVDSFQFKGYEYHDIVAFGKMQDGTLNVELSSDDPNVQIAGHGDIVLGDKHTGNRIKLDLDAGHINLHAINLDPRDSASIALALSADLLQTPEGAFLGQANLRSVEAFLPDQVYYIGDIALDSWQSDDHYFLTLDSDRMRADYEGSLFLSDYIDESIHLLYQDNLEHLFGSHHQREEDGEHRGKFGNLYIKFLDLQPVTEFFLPSLFIAPQSTFYANLQGDDFTTGLSSELAAYDNILLHNLQLHCLTEDGRIRAFVDAERLRAFGILADNLDIDATADTVIDLHFRFHNEDGSGNRANLHTRVSFPTPEQDDYPLRVDLLNSELAIADHAWDLSPAVVRYRDNERQIRIDNFAITNGEQSLRAHGVVGAAPTDTIRVMLNDFDLGTLNSFLTQDLNLQGLLTGQGEAFALLGPEKGILFDMRARHVSAKDIEMGNFELQSHWDDPGKQFLFYVDNTLKGKHPLLATAALRPSDKNLNLDLQVDSLQVGVVEPFLTGLASDMGGSISGTIRAQGPLDKLSISSEGTRFNDFQFTLDYTQVPYTANGPFTVTEHGVTFDNVRINDPFQHQGSLTGGVPYDHFNDIRLNLRIDLHDMMALNTTSHDNPDFYGRAFADGSVRVSGDLQKIRLSLNLTPTANTTIHIPLGESARASKSLLTFINNEKKISLIDSMILARQTPVQSAAHGEADVSVSLRLNATPDAEIQLEVDKNTGDILKARGNGMINITADVNQFDIKGDYRVDSGSYHFGMLGITAKDFSINPGGTIGFNGDVMQSDLDLTATYRTKASISPLIADSTAVSTRRTVICGIGVTGKLENPEIRFYVDIPDLDPTTQGRVESALNTEDKRMKQTLAVLLSGGFVPDEQSGIVNSTTLLFSNASEMMSSQLNNIFRQLDIPLDLGFNYQPNESGRDIFDVAVSTQLFNNRVIINGNIGNRQYMSSTQSNIVGDIDIEIKLNRQGQLRLTLFSHSADQYSNYLDQSQRNGAGIVYQEDFNSFKDLWRKIFHIKTDDREQTLSNSNPPRRISTE